MAQILQSKNLSTRFQILVEIAANQPTIHQKSIPAKLNVTTQAISEYMIKLEKDGQVVCSGDNGHLMMKLQRLTNYFKDRHALC